MLVNIHPADYLDLLHLLTKLFFPRQSLAFSVLDILTAKALAACTMGATPGDKIHILRETETLYNAIQLSMNIQYFKKKTKRKKNLLELNSLAE